MSKVLFSILLAAALVPDDTRYNVRAERMFEGIVASAGHVINGIVFFPLATDERVIEVELGPKEFVAKKGFNLKAGEMVTVVGVSTVAGGREMVLAREVRTMRAVLVLRDRNGLPMWDLDRPVEMDPEFSESNMCEMVMP
jgi:hypothetical protein